MLSAFCGFPHSPPSAAHHTLLMLGLGSAVLGWRLMSLLTIFAICVLFVVFHRCFFFFFFRHQIEFKRNLFESCRCVCVCVPHTHISVIILWHMTKKNRNLLAVNFTHSPRSLRQTLLSLFVAITFVVVCVFVVKMKSCSCGI